MPIDPNIQPFFGHGGKLLMYHGWADPLVAPGTSINYYNSVVKALGGPSKAAASVRLFMAPGMGHCGGGEGPNTFDMIGALERWVEQGQPPDADRRIALDQRRGRSHAAAVPVSPGRRLQRHRQHGRRRQLCVPNAGVMCGSPRRGSARRLARRSRGSGEGGLSLARDLVPTLGGLR